jgi:hypothetical protein
VINLTIIILLNAMFCFGFALFCFWKSKNESGHFWMKGFIVSMLYGLLLTCMIKAGLLTGIHFGLITNIIFSIVLWAGILLSESIRLYRKSQKNLSKNMLIYSLILTIVSFLLLFLPD